MNLMGSVNLEVRLLHREQGRMVPLAVSRMVEANVVPGQFEIETIAQISAKRFTANRSEGATVLGSRVRILSAGLSALRSIETSRSSAVEPLHINLNPTLKVVAEYGMNGCRKANNIEIVAKTVSARRRIFGGRINP